MTSEKLSEILMSHFGGRKTIMVMTLENDNYYGEGVTGRIVDKKLPQTEYDTNLYVILEVESEGEITYWKLDGWASSYEEDKVSLISPEQVNKRKKMIFVWGATKEENDW